MRILKLLCLIFFILLAMQCKTAQRIEKENKFLYEIKGFNEPMPKRLKPIIIYCKEELQWIMGINKTNQIAAVNKKDEFCLASINESGEAEIEPVVKRFPSVMGITYHSDSEHNLIWQTYGRSVYYLDLETKKSGSFLVSKDGGDKICNSFLIDPEKKILFIEIDRISPSTFFYVLYDLINDKIIYKSEYVVYCYPFDGQLLFIKIAKLGKYWGDKWLLSDIYQNNPVENKLTKALTKGQISIYSKSKTIHTGRRMALGSNFVNDKSTYWSIRWEEDFEDVRVEPLLLQVPKKASMSSAFWFSPDGNWVKTMKTNYDPAVSWPNELLIYQANEMYPQGLSMPIHCGYTKKHYPGGFMEHSVWGPCYVHFNPKIPDRLFVYKLMDGMKILAEQAKNKVKSK